MEEYFTHSVNEELEEMKEILVFSVRPEQRIPYKISAQYARVFINNDISRSLVYMYV